ncbi:MAG TPA: DinB family protein [Gemmatimonadaceae bacterium]
MKVLGAFPASQSEFRPHPRSKSARELAFTFVMEQAMISLALRDQLKLGGGMPKTPEDFGMIVQQFESDYEALVELIKSAPERAFEGTVDFFVGPGKVGPWPKHEFIHFMVRDQIHHRGQYSIYLRMAGGKVPAIYGPSADETWT